MVNLEHGREIVEEGVHAASAGMVVVKKAKAILLLAMFWILGISSATAQATFDVSQDQAGWNKTTTIAERW